MDTTTRGRTYASTAALCAVVWVLASSVHLLSMQAAYSPLSLPLPSGPFAQLEDEAFRLGLVALLAQYFDSRSAHPAPLARLFAAAVTLKLGLLAFASSQGMMAVQMTDPRALAPRLFAVRMFANVLLVLWALVAARRTWPRAPRASE